MIAGASFTKLDGVVARDWAVIAMVRDEKRPCKNVAANCQRRGAGIAQSSGQPKNRLVDPLKKVAYHRSVIDFGNELRYHRTVIWCQRASRVWLHEPDR